MSLAWGKRRLETGIAPSVSLSRLERVTQGDGAQSVRYKLVMASSPAEFEPIGVAAAASAEPPVAAANASLANKRMRWFELCVVIFISFGSSLYNAVYHLDYGPPENVSYSVPRALFSALQVSVDLLLLGYVLSRTGRKLRDIGLTWSGRDVRDGLYMYAGAFVAAYTASRAIRWIHFWLFGTAPIHYRSSQFFGHFSWALLPYMVIAPACEELIVRAYMTTEIRELTGSTVLATLASVGFQFSYHLYYGWTGAMSVSSMFVVFGIYFAVKRRATPVLIGHELYDLMLIFRM
jgi:membrane protease YdiL (CAAX protease family)